jgi:hypothetical protein
MLLLSILPESVFESTTVVATAAPFQRMAAWVGKFVPVTCNVVLGEPAVIVCGRTRVMLGFAASCAVEACCVVEEQPRIFRKREKLALNAMALKTLPKIHPKRDSNLPT